MGLVDKAISAAKDIFNKGPDNWYDRLKPNLKLKSPKKKKFEAKWREDQMVVEKRVGLYDLPKSVGTIAHDYGTRSKTFSIPFYFDGKDCDLKAMAFSAAIRESGTWEIDHPLYGLYVLQPLKITVITRPIEAGNIIEINSEWIEPIDEKTGKTGRELAGIVDELSVDVNNGIVDRFMKALKTGTNAYDNATKRATKGIQNLSDAIFAPLVAPIDAANALFISTQNALNDIQLATVFQAEQLIGQLQNLLQIPVASSRDLQAREGPFQDFAAAAFALTSKDRTDEESAVNELLVCEAALAAVLVARAQIIITTELQGIDVSGNNRIGVVSRQDAITAINNLKDTYEATVTVLDALQIIYENKMIDDQYQSFVGTYALMARLIDTTVAYLLSVVYDLSVERIIVLDRPRSPVDLAISEYGGLGFNDYYLDLLIASNKLTGDDIFIIPATREVKIYA